MSIDVTATDVTKIAALARLHLSAEEVAAATADLTNVLAHFSSIQSIATPDVPTATNVTGLSNIARADTVQTDALCAAADLLQLAPDVLDNHLKVPAVF